MLEGSSEIVPKPGAGAPDDPGMTMQDRPLRVMHVSSTYPPGVIGGAEKVVEQLAEAQAAQGVEVGVAYLVREAHPPGERNGVDLFPQADRNLIWMEDVMRRPRPLRTANKLLQVVNLPAARDFGRAIAAFRPDVVHTHSMVELPPLIWTEAKRAGAKVVHTLHDYDLICSRASLFRNGRNCEALHPSCRIFKAWKSRFTPAIDGVAAVSRPVLEEHRRHGLFDHLAADRRRVVWNAVPSADAPRRRAAAKDAADPFTFGYLGRLVPEKGVETLLRACRLLPAGGWRLRIAGRSLGDPAPLHALAEGLPVEFVGFVEPAAYLDTLDVLVVPSIWREPFGLTVVEAYARGVPVLGADQGAIADLVGTVGAQWLSPPGDAPALAARMGAVIAAGRAALPGPEAFEDVLAAVTPEHMVDGYAQLYAAVMLSVRAG